MILSFLENMTKNIFKYSRNFIIGFYVFRYDLKKDVITNIPKWTLKWAVFDSLYRAWNNC